MPNKLEVEYISIDDIKTYENNAKLHPAEQIEQIKKSIQEFGFNDPIAIDENNVIIEGHGRYIACNELGIKEVPIIRLEGLDEEHKKAYMLVHNKLTMNSDFDIELLSYELEDISIDMSDYGFDMDDIDIDELGTDFELPSGDKNSLTAISFSFSQEQADYINEKIKEFKDTEQFKNFKYEQNNNANGNAIYLMVSEWEKLKT